MVELPDPYDAIPPDWRTRSSKEKLEIHASFWGILGANIAYINDEMKRPDWEQLVLPLEEFTAIRSANGWCAPSEPEYALMEAGS